MRPVVSAAWLYEHLNDPHVAIADCRFSLADPHLGRQQYQAGHIPGAHYFDLNQDLSSPVERHGGRHPLPDPQRLAQTLGQAGIASNPDQEPTLVIAYDDARLGFAARFWWLLRYLGHTQVAVLDGGFSQWQAGGYPVITAQPARQPQSFVPRPQPGQIVDIEEVRARLNQPNCVLIDSREGDRYRGEREPIDPIAGHIPGAVNFPWQEVTDAHGRVRSIAEQHERWSQFTHTDDIVVYCGSGVTACVNLLSLELAGLSHARLYPGSWSDWCSYLSTTEGQG